MEKTDITTDIMEMETEGVIRGSEVGVGDYGTVVKFRSNVEMEEGNDMEGIEDIVVIDSCAEDVGKVSVGAVDMNVSNEMSLIVKEPKEGMVFWSWQEVEAYYKEYVEQMGFGVSRVQGVNSKTADKQRIVNTWKCECWGKPDMRARREANKRAKAMSVGGSGGLVDGVTVHLKHNHKINPANSKLVKEYRMKQMTSKVKKKLMDFYEQGAPISQIHGCMATERNRNMALTIKDLQHEVYKARRLKMVGGDSVAIMEYLEKMQSGYQIFFHVQCLDEEGRLKDVCWVDARSRLAYEDFGDVVCFDATYLTNEYELPFANFVGVNHHGQSLLLGCALVSHEE
ncbi:protein FAR-RED IMPAIRED RESPONSE 1-like [Chenopodium quinoa]|uniref:protein FAR-RED IMPAIRED RESPONSE 1-like n=1 Tax=Chenopodium quinoa TaxID=63459 RepID=UPI000B79642A|nr:protein FAR-RED IMPAIRED RESPONSE 1-like [Chenopodium quinoa]